MPALLQCGLGAAVLQERKEQEKAREERRRETKAANRVKKAISARRR